MIDFFDRIIGRPNTIVTYKSLFKNHIEQRLSENPADTDLEDLIFQWREEELSPRTIKSLIGLANRYIEYMGGPKKETKHLIKQILRQVQDHKIQVLTKEEGKLLIDSINNKELRLIVLLGLHAGLRRGEIFGLQWGDIDAIKNRIIVSRSYFGPTKNGKSRAIPISETLEKELQEWGYMNKKTTDRILYKIFDPGPKIRKACREAKLPELRTHDLRHTFATLALESSISPKTVQQWLGHSSLTTTVDIYWNALPQETKMDFTP